jgi:hypothetical protein
VIFFARRFKRLKGLTSSNFISRGNGELWMRFYSPETSGDKNEGKIVSFDSAQDDGIVDEACVIFFARRFKRLKGLTSSNFIPRGNGELRKWIV